MFFMVTFSAIKMLIEPDTLTDKNKGAVNIVKKVLIVIVMLGSSSFVFSGLYSIQTQVIQSGIITKVLMPKKINTDNFGGALSASLLTSFYSVNPAFSSDGSKSTDIDVIDKCEYYVNLLSYRIYHYNDFELGYNCLNEYVNVTRIDEDGVEGEESEMYVIKYTPIISTAVGLAVAYFLLMYCITVGVRTVQLAFLEVISPMAIIAYLSPKDDNMFKKWLRVYVSTYLDVFIRIAIINFAAFLIATILDNSSGVTSTFWSSVGDPTDFFTRTYLRIAIILALLTFAKKAPDLIKELFPVGASKLGFGFQSPKAIYDGLAGKSLISRGYGFGAVGLRTSANNFRRAVGKIATVDRLNGAEKSLLSQGRMSLYSDKDFDAIDDQIEALYSKDKFTSADQMKVDNLNKKLFDMKKHNDSAKRHNTAYDSAVNKRNEARKETRKWVGRAFGGAISGAVTGAARGLGTQDRSGRASAVKVGAGRKSSNWKMKDAGYTYQDRATDYVKDFFNMDTNLGQRTKLSDYELEAKQRELANYEKEHLAEVQNNRNIILENGNYYEYGKNGRVEVTDLTDSERIIADLNAAIGKAQSTNSALHQREREKEK